MSNLKNVFEELEGFSKNGKVRPAFITSEGEEYYTLMSSDPTLMGLFPGKLSKEQIREKVKKDMYAGSSLVTVRGPVGYAGQLSGEG